MFSHVQAFWRLQPTSNVAFHAILAFPLALAPDRTIAKGGTAPPLPPFKHVRITPGLSGAAITSTPLPAQAPTVQVRYYLQLQAHTAGCCKLRQQTPPRMHTLDSIDLEATVRSLSTYVRPVSAAGYKSRMIQGDATGSAQPKPAAEVAVGASQVHAFLLSSLRALVWDAASARCRFELAQYPQVLFAQHVVNAALHSLSPSAAPSSASRKALSLRVFRPLLLQLAATQLVPGRALRAGPLLSPALVTALKQLYLRAQIRSSLEEQVWQTKFVLMCACVACYKSCPATSIESHQRCCCARSRRCLQIARYPGATLITLQEGSSAIYAALARSARLGCIKLSYCSTGAGRERITVRALPAGTSQVHLSDSHAEYCLDAVSLADVEQLLERYWGAADRQ